MATLVPIVQWTNNLNLLARLMTGLKRDLITEMVIPQAGPNLKGCPQITSKVRNQVEEELVGVADVDVVLTETNPLQRPMSMKLEQLRRLVVQFKAMAMNEGHEGRETGLHQIRLLQEGVLEVAHVGLNVEPQYRIVRMTGPSQATRAARLIHTTVPKGASLAK